MTFLLDWKPYILAAELWLQVWTGMVTFQSARTPDRPFFCSLPCSPTGELTTVPFPWHPEAKLRMKVGVADCSDDFDFDLPVQQYKQQKHGADASFHTDEAPALKLPPCLQENTKKIKCWDQGLTRSHSRSSVSRSSVEITDHPDDFNFKFPIYQHTQGQKQHTSIQGMEYLNDSDHEFPVPKHKPYHKQHENNQHEPDMARASVAPPLKLPPCLQENSRTKLPRRRLTRSCSSSNILKRSFSCLNSRDEELDNDPFAAALVQVRSQSLSSMKNSSEPDSHQVAAQREATSSMSVKIKKVLLRCDSKGRVVFKGKLRSCTAALRNFMEMWKSRFKVRLQRK